MTRIRRIAAFVLCFLGAAASATAVAATPLYVGILEDFKTSDPIPVTSKIHVRVTFERVGKKWLSMKSDFDNPKALKQEGRYYPETVTWNVLFRGKTLGTITSRNPKSLEAHADVGAQIITTAPNKIPKVSVGASQFDMLEGQARYRPLLLVSGPNHGDPAGWKPSRLTPEEKAHAIREFRRKFPKMEQCKKPETVPVYMVPYSDDAIIFMSTYRSNKGEVIYGMRLDNSRSRCGFYDDDNFFDYWYVMGRHGQIRLLGSEMTPVDAADLDGNGASEWVFATTRGENEDGYRLFYENFKKSVHFTWTYH